MSPHSGHGQHGQGREIEGHSLELDLVVFDSTHRDVLSLGLLMLMEDAVVGRALTVNATDHSRSHSAHLLTNGWSIERTWSTLRDRMPRC